MFTAPSPREKEAENDRRLVAQLIIQKYEPIEFVGVEDLDETERGEGGFGSTGTK